jgi:DNA-binding transcriptional ArsR family regulator
MSLEEERPGARVDRTAELRALAHPLRLRMLSLLTGAAMTAAEIARELSITHANASYHLRQLFAVDLIEIVGEEHIRGGVAKRYRYHAARAPGHPPTPTFGVTDGPESLATTDAHQLVLAAVAVELQRRATCRRPGPAHLTDAELWVEPAEWAAVQDQINAASHWLHQAAHPPRTPDTIRVNATIAMFVMNSDR